MCGMMGALWFARWARHSHIYFARLLIPASCGNGYVALVGVFFLLVVIVLNLSVGVQVEGGRGCLGSTMRLWRPSLVLVTCG